MSLAHILGSLISVEMLWQFMRDKNLTEEENAAKDLFPVLDPNTSTYYQSCVLEILCTFLFVYSILVVKDRVSGIFHNHGAVPAAPAPGCKSMWYGAMTISLSLSAMISIAGPHTGCSINPAVSISQ